MSLINNHKFYHIFLFINIINYFLINYMICYKITHRQQINTVELSLFKST